MNILKTNEHLIANVLPDSIADINGIRPGDIMCGINGLPIADILDYRFLCACKKLTLDIKFKDGVLRSLDLTKKYEDDLGLEFDNSFMDDYRSCNNKCIFCFIDQMPPGMRDKLYFKDDDSRLSFLHGNYVTLTNMTDADVSRIIDLKMSPVNISIHTTDAKLRCEMLNNRFAGDSLKKMDAFFKAGIAMNGQIVLCKGVNDGEGLIKTIKDLTRYIPVLESVSIVPVGLTKYREGLYPLEPFSPYDAAVLIEKIGKLQKSLVKRFDTHFVHLSDEWYVMAKCPLPKEGSYDGYLQIENGVGMLRSFIEEIKQGLPYMKYGKKDRRISIATGALAYPYIKKVTKIIMKYAPKLSVNVYRVENEFFGRNVTVSGLLTGTDVIKTLTGKDLGQVLLMPGNAFKADEDIMLDDVRLEDLEKALGIRVKKTGKSGEDFLRALGFREV